MQKKTISMVPYFRWIGNYFVVICHDDIGIHRKSSHSWTCFNIYWIWNLPIGDWIQGFI